MSFLEEIINIYLIVVTETETLKKNSFNYIF
jgi:hypothetical protein